jgi:UDP-GlcNAc3NAcA epimerase
LVCDHLSTLIFVPTLSGMESLWREGFRRDSNPPYTADNTRVYHCGDIMYDNSLYFVRIAREKSTVLRELGLEGRRFGLVTMHRPSNVDDRHVLGRLFKAFSELASQNSLPLIVPLHPRTVKALEAVDHDLHAEVYGNPLMKIVPAVSFLDMTNLESCAEIIFTDSGGVQKEAYYFKKPCVILLEETPWVELVESGSAMLAGADPDKIMQAYHALSSRAGRLNFPEIFGDGKASEFIGEKIIENFGR